MRKILVVEDERPVARALELKFSSEGFEVAIALNGEVALLLLKEEAFDLILLDLIMPKVDGFEVLRELRQRNVTIPVFVLSNLSQPEDEQRVRALGASEYFVKSNVPIGNIVERVKQALG